MTREVLRARYSDLIIVSIAGGNESEQAFSADTRMAECLIVARKGRGTTRATFAVLDRQPLHQLEATEIARLIRHAIGACRRLEDGPVGATPLLVGANPIGSVIEAPLPIGSPWPVSRIADMSIAQTSYELADKGRLWLPGTAESKAPVISIVKLSSVATMGPYHMDINASGNGGAIRGPFELRPATKAPTYPVLWSNDTEHQQFLAVVADQEGQAKSGKNKAEVKKIASRVEYIASTASHAHLNKDFRFNSQPLAMAFTDTATIGGHAWPSVIMVSAEHAMALTLWQNCTLGLMMYWWTASKQRAGRGRITISAAPSLPVFDVTSLTKKQLERCKQLFDAMRSRALRPMNEIDCDANRQWLDSQFLGGVLGLPANVIGEPLQLLRRKLSSEPSIGGGKRVTAAPAPTAITAVIATTRRKGPQSAAPITTQDATQDRTRTRTRPRR
jgi:hypothetical protein